MEHDCFFRSSLYIIAPLLIIPLARLCSRRAAMVLLGFIALLSLAYYILTTSFTLLPEPTRLALLQAMGCQTAYYHLLPRFWELAAGAGVFLLPGFDTMPRLRSLLGCLGLAGFVASCYLYETGSPAVYMAVISSLLALRYAATGAAAWLLNSKPMQALGTISFSLFLWHWPIMVFWKYCSMNAPGPWGEAGMVLLSLLMGALGWWALERLRIPSRSGWQGAFMRSAIVLLIPVVLIANNQFEKYAQRHLKDSTEGLPVTASDITHEEIVARLLSPEDMKGLEGLPELDLKNPPLRVGVAGKQPSFILIGDSFAQHIHNALHEVCLQEGESGIFFFNSVVPCCYLNQPKNLPDHCCWNQEISDTLFNYLKVHPNIHCLVINESWWRRLSLMTNGMDWRTGHAIAPGEERIQFLEEGLRELSRQLREVGVETVLLGCSPEFPVITPVDEWLRHQRLSSFGLTYKERVVTAEEYNKKTGSMIPVLQRLAAENYVHLIEVESALRENGVYPARSKGEFLYVDNAHYSVVAARRVARHIMPQLLKVLRREQPESAAPQPLDSRDASCP